MKCPTECRQRLLLGWFYPPLAPGAGIAGRCRAVRYYDLDWIVTIPNMGSSYPILRHAPGNGRGSRCADGVRSHVAKAFRHADAEAMAWETDTIEKLESFEFDDALDPRRYFAAGDNQIAGVGTVSLATALPG